MFAWLCVICNCIQGYKKKRHSVRLSVGRLVMESWLVTKKEKIDIFGEITTYLYPKVFVNNATYAQTCALLGKYVQKLGTRYCGVLQTQYTFYHFCVVAFFFFELFFGFLFLLLLFFFVHTTLLNSSLCVWAFLLLFVNKILFYLL